jgi:transcription elongation GreA/GreB family factor
MTFKGKVFKCCLALLEEKVFSLQTILRELEDGAQNDNKSSAGDKHETARAMMQLEQEKISKQLSEVVAQKASLEKLENITSDKIRAGSLIGTNRGFLYLGIAPAKITVEETNITVLTEFSPLGKKLVGLKTGDQAEVNGMAYIIESVQ